MLWSTNYQSERSPFKILLKSCYSGLFFGHFSAIIPNSKLADYQVFDKILEFFVIILEFSCKNHWVFFAKILEICYQDIQISYVLSLLLNLLGFSCPLKSITSSLSISHIPELADLEVFCLFALEFFEKLLEFFRFLEFILLEFF